MKGNFKVYKSSAGSGKTFTLVREYLKICLQSKDPFVFSHVLAITFTNKATYEMKGRILSELENLSNLNESNISPMVNYLIQDTGLGPTEIKIRANRIFHTILHHYADFGISTIDRFNYKLVRVFTKDLGLSYQFQLDLQEKVLLQKVIEQMLDNYGRDKELSALILDLLMFKMSESKSWKLGVTLVEFAMNLLNENAFTKLFTFRGVSSKDISTLNESYKKLNQAFEHQIKDIGVKGLSIINSQSISPTSFYRGKQGIPGYFKYLAGFNKDRLYPNSYVISTLEEDQWTSTKCSNEEELNILAIKEDLQNLATEAIKLVESELPSYLSRKLILKNIKLLALIHQIEKRFQLWKSDHHLLNISDLNRIISKVVLSESIPFVFERLGERYNHLMIDEFQDTSVLQFLNLMPLMEESLSKGNFNLVVGDAKQAIYRFRGGEVGQLAEMPNYLPEDHLLKERYLEGLNLLAANYEEENLNVNRRSNKLLVDFNNRLFNFIVEHSGNSNNQIANIYQEFNQESVDNYDGAYIELSFSELRGEELKQDYLERVYKAVKESIEDGYALKDIAILCRNTKEIEGVAGHLKNNGIAILSSEALKLNTSEEVRFLLDFLSYLNDETIISAKLKLIGYLTKSKLLDSEITQLHENIAKGDITLSQLLASQFDLSTNSLKQLSIFELVEELIRTFELHSSFDLYLQVFQEKVLEYSSLNENSLSGFLNWWELYGDQFSINLVGDQNAVQIMTIHKSKGLEFPVVIYPFAKQALVESSRSDLLWVELENQNLPFALVDYGNDLKNSDLHLEFEKEKYKKEVDLINLTYVALTRAKERLYIHSETPPKNPMNISLNQWLFQFALTVNTLDENLSLTFGNRVMQKSKVITEKVDPKYALKYCSNAWREKLIIADGLVKEEHKLERLQYGNLLHEILAQLNTETDLIPVLNKMVLGGKIILGEKEEILKDINSLLSDPEVSQFFKHGTKNRREASFINKLGEVMRPDRVVYFEDEIAILDFKTGSPSEQHNTQLNTYKKHLEEIYSQKVKAYLLYTESKQLKKVV